MRHFTRFTALFLAAALLLSGCSLSSERTGENSTPESSSPVSEAFDPLAVGLLGHTDSDSPPGTQPLGEDAPLTEALYLPDGLEGEMLRVCVYDSARQGYTLRHTPAAAAALAGDTVPAYGARELRRKVSRAVEQALADRIAAGTARPGVLFVADAAPDGHITLTMGDVAACAS